MLSCKKLRASVFRVFSILLSAVALTASAAGVEPVLSLAKKEQPALIETLKEVVEIESGSRDTAGLELLVGGYRQTWDYLDGKLSLAQLREQGIAATLQLAKRQLTWLRAMENVARFDCLAEDASAKVLAYFGTALKLEQN